jgi:hypothetical protein
MSKKHSPLKKHQYSKPVQEQITDMAYMKKLNKRDKKWLEQFIDEYYGNNHQKYSEDEGILNTEEMYSEARRISNSFNRDAYDVAKKTMSLDYSENDDKVFYSKEHICDWLDAYKVNGHKDALEMIINESLYEVIDSDTEDRQRDAMIRFFIRMRRYFTQVNKEKQNDKK